MHTDISWVKLRWSKLTNMMTPQVLRTKQQREPIGPQRKNVAIPTAVPGLGKVSTMI